MPEEHWAMPAAWLLQYIATPAAPNVMPAEQQAMPATIFSYTFAIGLAAGCVDSFRSFFPPLPSTGVERKFVKVLTEFAVSQHLASPLLHSVAVERLR